MREQRQMTIEIGDLLIALFESEVGIDPATTRGKNRQLNLWHELSLGDLPRTRNTVHATSTTVRHSRTEVRRSEPTVSTLGLEGVRYKSRQGRQMSFPFLIPYFWLLQIELNEGGIQVCAPHSKSYCKFSRHDCVI